VDGARSATGGIPGTNTCFVARRYLAIANPSSRVYNSNCVKIARVLESFICKKAKCVEIGGRKMKRAVCACVIFSVLMVVATCAQAATYTYTLSGSAGTYGPGASRAFSVDFGHSFSSIQSMSIVWSGSVTPGYYQFYDLNTNSIRSGPWTGQFGAYITELGLIKHAATTDYGESTYPSSESFDVTSSFTAQGSWAQLLDGKTTMGIEFDPIILGNPGPGTFDAPSGYLNGATLVLQATAVPEPTSALAILCGFGAAGSLLRRKRR
jgi:hypothetical protein